MFRTLISYMNPPDTTRSTLRLQAQPIAFATILLEHKLSRGPDGHTECALPKSITDAILAQPGFPHPVPVHFSPVHCMAAVRGKDWGLLATDNIAAGKLILAERALLITLCEARPVRSEHIPKKMMSEQDLKADFAFWARATRCENQLVRLLSRMPREKAGAYRALPNAQTYDGVPGPMWGVMCTNSRELRRELKKTFREIPDDDNKEYECVGVCEMLSRVNHNCRPNAVVTFDLPCFSFRLHAARPIPAGAEITISYINQYAPTETCQQLLELFYNFTCTWDACRDPRTDERRHSLIWSPPWVGYYHDLTSWLVDYECALPDDYLTKPCRDMVMLIEREQLQAGDDCGEYLSIICMAYGVLGDREGYLWARSRGRHVPVQMGRPSFGLNAYSAFMSEKPEMHPFWRLRQQTSPRLLNDLFDLTPRLYRAYRLSRPKQITPFEIPPNQHVLYCIHLMRARLVVGAKFEEQ